MKPIYFLYITFFCLMLNSCSEDFLDLSPHTGYTLSNYFETEDQINSAIVALYPIMRNQYKSSIWIFEEFRSDNTTFQFNPADRGRQKFESIDYFEADATNGDINSLWVNSYSGIARTHYILENIDSVFFNDGNEKLIRTAETRFFRAFFYAKLTNYFGDVPLVTETITTEKQALTYDRKPIDSIQNEIIIPDLLFAIEHLPSEINNEERGRISKGAAQMLLAKIYSKNNDYISALPILNNLISEGPYALENNFRDVFDPENESANSEVILAAQYSIAAQQGNLFISSWLPNNSGTTITEDYFVNSLQGRNIPTHDIINEFETGDKRFDHSIKFYIANNDTVPYIQKFIFPPITNSGSDTDIPIFRLADALLMQAEALLETEGGIPDLCLENINTLRARAGLPFYYPGNPNPDYDVTSEDQLRQILRKERRVELAFEGFRFSDLIRYGNMEEIMSEHGLNILQYQDFLSDYPTAYTNITRLLGLPAEQVKLYGYNQNNGW